MPAEEEKLLVTNKSVLSNRGVELLPYALASFGSSRR